jgi:hypothetical protein
MRRHRQRSSPAPVTSSNVARPSGPANDHVISKIPSALVTDLTRSNAGNGVAGSVAYASQAGANLVATTTRKAARRCVAAGHADGGRPRPWGKPAHDARRQPADHRAELLCGPAGGLRGVAGGARTRSRITGGCCSRCRSCLRCCIPGIARAARPGVRGRRTPAAALDGARRDVVGVELAAPGYALLRLVRGARPYGVLGIRAERRRHGARRLRRVLLIPAPAGAGLREVVLLLVLRSILSNGQALAVVIGSRVLLIVADLLLAGLAAAPRAVRSVLTRERH